MRLPVAAEPVKNTPSTGCASKAAPTSPAPTSIANTSCGTPLACSNLLISQPVRLAYSDGL